MPTIPLTHDSPSGHDDAPSEVSLIAQRIAQSLPPPPPHRVGRHTVIARIGMGGMGIVYSAYDPELDRKVAVKLIRPGHESEKSRMRLVREAQAMARVSHLNVVSIHDTGMYNNSVYVVMDFVDGSTLRSWLAEGRRPWREVVAIFLQAGRGLEAAHAAGLVHRDFKPDNVLIDRSGIAKVTDFGLARPMDESRENGGSAPVTEPTTCGGSGVLGAALTSQGVVLGTPKYMAPEHLDARAVTAAADQFSFCVALYEALFHEDPFQGNDATERRDNLRAGRIRAAPPASSVPARLRAVVLRGLKVAPVERWASMEELRGELERVLHHDPGRRWRRVAAALAAPLLATLVWGGFMLDRQWTIAACQASGVGLDAAWNDETRAGLERRFAAARRPYLQTSYHTTSVWIDQWVTDWSWARAELCRLHEVEGEWDKGLHARGADCLADAAHRLELMLTRLANADEDALSRAPAEIASLPRASACLDRDTVAVRPLVSPDHRDEVAAIRRRLEAINDLARQGNYHAGLEEAHRIRSAAQALEWGPLIADAEFALGYLAENAGNYGEAEAALERAVRVASESKDGDRIVKAGTQLMFFLGTRGGRYAEARVWGNMVASHLALLPGEHSLLDADLKTSFGAIHLALGENDTAGALFEEVIAIRTAAFGANHPDLAVQFSNLAIARQRSGAADEARSLFERALAIEQSFLGEDHPDVGLGLLNLAVLLNGRGEHERARADLERALSILERALGPEHDLVATALLGLADTYYDMKQYSEARDLLRRAIVIQEKQLGPKHPSLAIAYNNLGNVLKDARNLAEARPLFEQALALWRETLGSEHVQTAYPLTGLGEIALAEQRMEDAKTLFQHALRLRVAGRVLPGLRGRSRFGLAQALWSDVDQRDHALALAREAREEFSQDEEESRADLVNIEAWLQNHQEPLL